MHLACLLKEGANVLLLDEPTNDLDVNTMRALEEALEHFGGCAVVISHDRWFLERIATHILAFEGDTTVRWFEVTTPTPRPTASEGSARMRIRRTGSSIDDWCGSSAAIGPVGPFRPDRSDRTDGTSRTNGTNPAGVRSQGHGRLRSQGSDDAETNGPGGCCGNLRGRCTS